MKLSLVAIWLAQSMIVQSYVSPGPWPAKPQCFCPKRLKSCTSCVNNTKECSSVCTTKCFDLVNDSQNCGFCGNVVSPPHPSTPRRTSPTFSLAISCHTTNVSACHHQCPSGKCSKGQCVPQSCPGGVCGKFELCGGDSCYCITDSKGQSFCGVDTTCENLKDCKSNDDCPASARCSVNTCCARNVCLNICHNVTISTTSNSGKLAKGTWAAG